MAESNERKRVYVRTRDTDRETEKGRRNVCEWVQERKKNRERKRKKKKRKKKKKKKEEEKKKKKMTMRSEKEEEEEMKEKEDFFKNRIGNGQLFQLPNNWCFVRQTIYCAGRFATTIVSITESLCILSA